MTELGFKRRMPLVALALLACEQLKIPIGYGAPPSDSAPSGGQTSYGGAASTGGAGGTDAGNAGANDGGTSQGGSSGVGGEGGEPNPPGGAGGGPSTAPALWFFSSLTIERWCEGPSAVGTIDFLNSVGRWSPAEGVVPLAAPPDLADAWVSPTALFANADCSMVATIFDGMDSTSVVLWSGSEPGTIISTSPLIPFDLPVNLSANADLSSIASTIIEGTASRIRLWKAGVVTELAPPAGFSHMLPNAFNPDGSVLFGIVSQRPLTDNPEFDKFRWTEATGAVALPELRSCSITTMARDGSRVFGPCGLIGGGAFVWRADTGLASLGEPSSTSYIYPEYATADGSTVTGAYEGFPGGLFVWREDRGFELVASSGGPPTTMTGSGYAYGMSADGRVIVAMVGTDVSKRPIRWSASAGVSELEVPPTEQCWVSSLSEDGRIAAGGCSPPDSNAEAVIWDSDGKVQRLDDLLRTAGVDSKGAQFNIATVHSSGRFVWGNTYDDQTYVVQLP